MKLTQKLFLFFFVILVSTAVTVSFLSSQIFLQGFSQIEDEFAYASLHRISQILKDEAAGLSSTGYTWSQWDDTYNFVTSKDIKYIQNNWDSDLIYNTKLNQVFVIAPDKQILFSRGYDGIHRKHYEIDASQIQLIQAEIIPLLENLKADNISGLFVGSGHKSYVLFAAPILTSKAKGPAKGWLALLREIDSSMKNRFVEILRLDMDFSVGDAQEWAAHVTAEGFLQKKNTSIEGLVAIPDVTGKRKLIARLEIPRTIYSEGRKTVFSFMMIIGFILTISFGLVFFGFHRDVLRKILDLKNRLNEIGSQSGQLLRISWSGKDEIAELSQNINSMLDRLENSQVMISRASKFSALGEMAGSIAHEINNPLAIITGFCTRLIRSANRSELDRADITETSNRILVTANRIDRIIKSLRLVSRDGERDPKDEVALGEIIEEVISLCENKLEESKIELKLEGFDRNQKVTVRFVQIVQVFLNLFTNSIDAIAHQEDKWIELKTDRDGQFIHVYVLDSGRGIPQDIAEKVMNPFFTTKELGRGTGLGLSISKGIVEGHSGTFTLLKDAENTCFKISLPR